MRSSAGVTGRSVLECLPDPVFRYRKRRHDHGIFGAFIECQNGFGCYNLIGSYPQGDEKAQAEIFAAIDSFQSSGPAGTISQRFYDERLPFQFIYWESDGEITFNVVNENLLHMVNEAGNVEVEIQCRPSSDQFNKEVWLDGLAEVMVNQPGLKREEGRWEHETGGIDWIVDRYTYTLDGQTPIWRFTPEKSTDMCLRLRHSQILRRLLSPME